MGVPHGHRKTTTFVAGLRLGGTVAPMVLDGRNYGGWFEAYVHPVLATWLCHGYIFVVDNLSSHERVAARELIEAAGAELRFLPPYSPDLKPIEMAFEAQGSPAQGRLANRRKPLERQSPPRRPRIADQERRLLLRCRLRTRMIGKRSRRLAPAFANVCRTIVAPLAQ